MIYSPIERALLSDIACLDYDKANALDLIKKHTLEDRALLIDFQKKTIRLLVPLSETKWIGSFFEVIVFLEELERSGLIYLHSNNPESSINTVIGEKCYSVNIDQKFIDTHQDKYGYQEIPTSLYEKAQKLSISYIIPTSRLRILVAQNFQTEEQVNFKRNICIAYISLAIAFFALIFSLASPFIFETTLDSAQFESLKNVIKVR
jgi:hypothetical protein